MSYLEILKEACDSLGEGYFELLSSLLAPHLGEDPFTRLFDDPSGFIRSLRVALGGEADRFLVALAATLKQRGVDVNARSLERTLEIGDREKVRALFESASTSTPLESGYRELMLKQLEGLSVSRKRRVAISSLLLGVVTFSLVYLIASILGDYLTQETLNNILIIGLIASAALSIENYLINIPGVPRAQLNVRVRVLDASALKRSRIPELAEAILKSNGSVDIVELSRATSVPLTDLISEMILLQRDGAIKLEPRR
ncbi:MAG: hypothetical protein QXK42_04975 [Candidatus Korarchaeum sp.]